MTSAPTLHGVYLPLITPFAADGSVALDAVTELCHEYLDAGATGIVPLGTTGESSALTAEEKRAVVAACSAVCVERNAQLIVGAGTNSDGDHHRRGSRPRRTPGLSGVLIVVPYYVRPSEAGIVAHFKAVADASPVPVVLYNVAFRTGRHLSAAGVLEAAAHPNIVGIKQATGLETDTLELLRDAPADFAVLGGEDAFLFPLMLMGVVRHHLRIRARAHRPVRLDDRVWDRRQGRRRPGARRGVAGGGAGVLRRAEPRRLQGSSPRGRVGSRRPTYGCRSPMRHRPRSPPPSPPSRRCADPPRRRRVTAPGSRSAKWSRSRSGADPVPEVASGSPTEVTAAQMRAPRIRDSHSARSSCRVRRTISLMEGSDVGPSGPRTMETITPLASSHWARLGPLLLFAFVASMKTS